MTQIQFNLNVEDIKGIIIKSELDEVVKSCVVLILNEYMEKERDEHVKAKAYERSDHRQDYRNGYHDRGLLMSLGRVELLVPRTRSGDFSTTLFEKYQRTEQSFLLAILEMYLQGVSTRNVTKVIKKLNGASISKSMVSKLTAKIQTEIETWNNRRLEEISYCPYIFLDATYIKAREENKVIAKAIYIAKGLTNQGKRTILGLKVAAGESFDMWCQFISDLKKRGLAAPKLVISDAHEALKRAVELEFNGASWQRCLVHFKRNIVDAMPKKDNVEVKHDFQRIYQEIDPQKAREQKNSFIQKYENENTLQKAIRLLDEGFEDSIQYMNEPTHRHIYIRSTNALERVNQMIKARAKVIKIFPNDDSAFRIAGSILLDYDEKQKHKNCLF